VDAERHGARRQGLAGVSMSGPEEAPAVSVLMTAYNRAAYIDAAIESVLAQTFTDFELVVVDDGSTDDTVARARVHAARDARVRVEVNARNLGDYPNRNHAASLARGRYLKYHDSDDVMYPHCLQVMVWALESAPAAAVALSRGAFWSGAASPVLLTPRMAYQREFLGSRMFNSGPGGALFRTEAFRASGGFEDVGAPSDYVFWLKLCARQPVVLAPADLFWYREHSGQSLTSPLSARQYARAAARAWAALAAADCPLDPHERHMARRNHAYDVMRAAAAALRRGEFGVALEWLRHGGPAPHEWFSYLRPSRRDQFAGMPRAADGECQVPAVPAMSGRRT
jgi:hypothetical protein